MINKVEKTNRMKKNKLFQGHFHSETTKKIMSEKQKGVSNSNWNEGRTKTGGYISILKPEHPFADVNGRVKEERLVMEKHLGRFLKKEEIIHHKDNNPGNNNIENLQILSQLEHIRNHLKGKKRKPFSIKWKENMSFSHKGKKHTEETKKKISEALKGKEKSPFSSEHIKKLSKAKTGAKDSTKTKKRKSEAAKKAWERRKEKKC